MSNIALQKYIEYLDSNNIEYMLDGYENNPNRSDKFMSKIKFMKDKTSLHLRHRPDLIVLPDDGSVYVEVKMSGAAFGPNIEMDSFLELENLAKQDIKVWLVIYWKSELYIINNVLETEFFVTPYDNDVRDDHWIFGSNVGSGTPFGRINKDCLIKLI